MNTLNSRFTCYSSFSLYANDPCVTLLPLDTCFSNSSSRSLDTLNSGHSKTRFTLDSNTGITLRSLNPSHTKSRVALNALNPGYSKTGLPLDTLNTRCSKSGGTLDPSNARLSLNTLKTRYSNTCFTNRSLDTRFTLNSSKTGLSLRSLNT